MTFLLGNTNLLTHSLCWFAFFFDSTQYMQRGGKWDNTDIKGARNRKSWLSSDKEYASGGYKKEQSVSIFGVGGGLDWTGQQGRTGPQAATAAKRGQPQQKQQAPKKKGWFGF